MKLIKSSYKIIPQEAGLEGIYKAIERAGRTCYKSEDKITDTSAKEFIDRMIKSGHGAMLEHGTVYLTIPAGKYSFLGDDFDDCNDIKDSFFSNPYTKIHCQDGYFYISTNYRVMVETFAQEFIPELLQYLCEPTEFHEKRVCVRFICDRGVSHEFVRHRVMSFAQESTRYCNYSKDKFGNELTFIIPCWLDIPTGHYAYWDGNWCDIDKMKIQLPVGEHKDIDAFLWTLNNTETHYTFLINSGWKPQEARAVLPNSLKTELVVTGFISDWQHFFGLRCDKAAHPQARELAIPLQEEFIKRGYIN